MDTGQPTGRSSRRRRSSLLPRVEVEFLIVADAVEALNGKLYMLGGGWDTMQVANFSLPVAFGIGCGVLVPWNETDEEHTFTLRFEDADGGEVAPRLDGAFKTGRSALLDKGASTRILLGIKARMKIPSPGGYSIVAQVDGQPETERRTTVRFRGPELMRQSA